MKINISKGNSNDNNYNINSPKTKTSYKTFITNNSPNKFRTNITKNKRINSYNNSNKKLEKENEEIKLDEMMRYILDKENEKGNTKKINLINPINYRKDSEKKKKIINSLNDRGNPYSALFYNSILYNNYNVGLHYKELEQGVPYLRIKKINKKELPPLNQGNNLPFDDKFINKTYSSGFNLNKKKKIMIVNSKSIDDKNNKTTSSKKKSATTSKRDIDAKILFHSYEDKTDFSNDKLEFPKSDEINKNKNDTSKGNNKDLDGIVEEEN